MEEINKPDPDTERIEDNKDEEKDYKTLYEGAMEELKVVNTKMSDYDKQIAEVKKLNAQLLARTAVAPNNDTTEELLNKMFK